MTLKKRVPKLDESYFEKHPEKLFLLQKALKSQSIKDDQLDDLKSLRLIVKEMKLTQKLGASSRKGLKNFIEGQGGIKKFLNRPLIVSNVYIAMATFNLRHGHRINQKDLLEISSSTSINETHSPHPLFELLDEDLSDEVASEAYRIAYQRICSNKSYDSAKEAVEKYVKEITDEQADMVKDYLRDYITEHINSEAKDESMVEEESEPSKPSTSAKRSKPKQQTIMFVTKRHPSVRRSLMKRPKRKSLINISKSVYNASIVRLNLEQREEAVAAREKAISLREAAVAAREKALRDLRDSDPSFVEHVF